MNKFAVTFLASAFDELKYDQSQRVLDKIQNIIQTEIPSFPCMGVIVNDSPRGNSYYGMLVFPKVVISEEDRGFTIKSYVVEIQKQMLEMLTGMQLAAYLVHDLSHNVLTNTVIERLKAAIFNACKMVNFKVIDVIYNMDNKMRDLAIIDMANRTYKDMIVPGLEIYEADRILVDLDIYPYFNEAVKIIDNDPNTYRMNNMPDNLADDYMAEKLIKMVMEKYKEIKTTYVWLRAYIMRTYETKVLTLYPSIEIELKEELFGQKVSQIETMKPNDLNFLRETVVLQDRHWKKMHESTSKFIQSKVGKEDQSLIIESIFKQSRPEIMKLNKEFDIISYRMQNVSTNYERLSLLDRIYDTVFLLDKYLQNHPEDETILGFKNKFLSLTDALKDVKPSKRTYGVFVEYPAGFEG